MVLSNNLMVETVRHKVNSVDVVTIQRDQAEIWTESISEPSQALTQVAL